MCAGDTGYGISGSVSRPDHQCAAGSQLAPNAATTEGTDDVACCVTYCSGNNGNSGVVDAGFDFDCRNAPENAITTDGQPNIHAVLQTLPDGSPIVGDDFFTCCQISGACSGNADPDTDIVCSAGSMRLDVHVFDCDQEPRQTECGKVEDSNGPLTNTCCQCRSDATRSVFYEVPALQRGCSECPANTQDDDNNPITRCRPVAGYFYDGDFNLGAVPCIPSAACGVSAGPGQPAQWGATADGAPDEPLATHIIQPVEGCAIGYEDVRCSACSSNSPSAELDSFGDPIFKSYYREGLLCVECPEGAVPFLLIIFFIFLIVLAVVFLVDWLISKIKHVHDLVAPVMILCTFFQTIALLAGMKLKYPASLARWFQLLSAFNFSLDLGRPECSIDWTFYTKLQVTVYMPVVLAILLGLFSLVQLRGPIQKLRCTAAQLKQKLILIWSFCFSYLSIFYLKTVTQSFVCNSANYLQGNPTVRCVMSDECIDGKDCYFKIVALGGIGVVMYIAGASVLTVGMVCFHKKGYFYFWTDKMEPRWFFWELFVIARKVCLMLSVTYLPDHVELGWLLGVLTLIAASTMHAFAMPFMDEHIDSCEQFALLGAVLTYMAGLVFTYEAATCTRLGDDISDADEDADDNCLSKPLEYFAAIVIIATCVLSIYAEVRMIFKRQAMAKDYSKYMDKEVQKLRNANEKTVKMYEAQAKEMVERDEKKQETHENPLAK